MSVLRIRLARPFGHHLPPAIRILPATLEATSEPLRGLLAACRPCSPCPTVRGLCQDARDRPTRRVRGWLAWRAADPLPAGLVTLVTATVASCERHSVGWLLVRPDLRRQGLATALVGTVADAVMNAGGRELLAETLDRWPEAAAFWNRLAAADGRDRRT